MGSRRVFIDPHRNQMPTHTIDIQTAPGVHPKISNSLIRRVAKKTFNLERLNQPTEVGVLLTTDEEIRDLNQRYRGIDRPTDVLSFSLEEENEMVAAPPDGVRWLGEVVVSYPQAIRQAAEYGHSEDREVAFLIAHGLLHLLGYDHESPEDEAEMLRRQEEILQSLGLPRA